DLRPLRHFGQPLAPTPTADYPPRASRFPGGQRVSEFLNRAQVHESNIQETTYHTQGYISAYAHYENFLDQELNKAYERLMGHLDEDAQQTLRDSQRNWLKYRDAEFEFIALNWTPGNFGSSSVISRGDYRTTLIKDRVRVGSRMIE
ncbi:MAG: hypothetical protein, partial [Olavius algarvensis Gamma 1 endosymbiont]